MKKKSLIRWFDDNEDFDRPGVTNQTVKKHLLEKYQLNSLADVTELSVREEEGIFERGIYKIRTFGQGEIVIKVLRKAKQGAREYHEEIKERELPYASEVIDEAFARAFMKIDPVAFGLSIGLVSGVLIFLVTIYVGARGIEELIYFLYLLNQYLPGYDVNIGGSLLGLIYGFLIGFLFGWGIITLRNLVIRLYISIIRRRAEVQLLEKYGFFPDEQSARTSDTEFEKDD